MALLAFRWVYTKPQNSISCNDEKNRKGLKWEIDDINRIEWEMVINETKIIHFRYFII